MCRYPNGAYSALQVGYAGSFDVELYTGVLPYDNAAGGAYSMVFPVYRPCNRQKMLLAVGNLSACLFDFFQWCAEDFPTLHIIRIRFTILNLYGKPLQKNMPFNIGLSYLIIAALLIFGILIFALLTLLIAAIHNKLIKRTK